MEYGVLGQLRAADRDGAGDCTPRGQRARDVLAMLVARHGSSVDAQVVLDAVWAEDAHRLTPAVVHTVVARLRRTLGEDQVLTTDTGYRLAADADLDADRFTDLVARARAATPVEAIPLLRTALGMWRGDRAYDDVTDVLVEAERQRLDGLRGTATENLVAILVTRPDPAGWEEAGEHAEQLLGRDPLREQTYELLMLARYLGGRQAEALATYTRLRTVLRDELGVDPRPSATELHRRILGQDPTLTAPRSPTRLRTAETRGAAPRPVPRRGESIRTPVGREPELARIADFLATHSGVQVVLGTPGIGKSALWAVARDEAATAGYRVLSARPGEDETRFSFSVLNDLLDGIDLSGFTGLPAPQRAALETALLRSPSSEPPDAHAIGLGLGSVLTELAADEPVVVAIDDVQWMDTESAEALTFASRRLDRSAVRFLLTRRSTHERTSLERAFPGPVHHELDVPPLDLASTATILAERGLEVPRRVVRLVHEQAGGNALFTHELAQVLLDRGIPEKGESLGVPADVGELLGLRVDELARDQRAVLLAVTLESHLTEEVLSSISGTEALEDALRSRLVTVDGSSGRVRAWHPMLAAAARDRSTPAQRRSLHQQLAELVPNTDSRARHLGLGHTDPDQGLAELLAQTSADALARRAFETAIELSALALARTPATDPERPRRVIAHAEQLFLAGWAQRLTAFLEPEVDSLPTGLRGRAWLVMVHGMVENVGKVEELIEHALRDSGGDPSVDAEALSDKAAIGSVVKVVDIDAAVRWGEDAVALDPVKSDGLAWARGMSGLEIDFDSPAGRAWGSSARIARAMQYSWRGEVVRAREILVHELNAADREGRSLDFAEHQLHLAEVHLRAGELDTAEAVLGLWAGANENAQESQDDQRLGALHAALRGDAEQALRAGAATVELADRIGTRWAGLEARRAFGTAAWLTGDPDTAAEHLGHIWSWCEQEGVREPGAFPVAGELVEALLATDRHDDARAVTVRLQHLSQEQSHPWGLATARRCRALLDLATGAAGGDVVAAELRAAAESYRELGLLGEQARTLLVAGTALDLPDASAEAAEIFRATGAHGWAARARALG